MLTRVPPELSPMTRRRVLLGATVSPLLLVATACTEDPPPTVAPDPDREALQAAYVTEDELRSALTNWAAPRAADKAAAVGIVDQHLEVLGTSLGGASSPERTASASASSPAETTATVVGRLDAAADEHSKALRTSGAQIGPLLASIAASDAALAASLRGNDR
jgi:hypothetical protein